MQVNGSTLPSEQDSLPRPGCRLGYTPAEVASIFGKHPNTIYVWIKSGVIGSRRINRVHYIPVAEVRALLDEGAVA